MKQESFIYAFVARGTVVVAEYTAFTGNFPAVAAQCLQRLPPATNNKFVYNYDNHSFNFLLHNGYAYCVVARESVTEKLCVAFLERVKQDFVKAYGDGKADAAVAKSLNKDFGPIMKEHMQYVVEHAAEIDKIAKLQDEVSQVKNVMQENINKALDKSVQLTTLVEKTEDLRDGTRDFERGAGQIRRKMWYKNMKVKLTVIGIILMIVLIIWLSICHGFNCSN